MVAELNVSVSVSESPPLPPPLTLRPFQAKAAARMTAEKRHLLLFKMGLGKTPTIVTALYNIRTTIRRVLIIAPTNSHRTWEDHLIEWFDNYDLSNQTQTPLAIYRWRKRQHDAAARRALWQTEKAAPHINVYIMTYAGFLTDAPHIPNQFDVIINDEPHRRIRKRGNKTFEALLPFVRKTPYYWAGTGTPGHLPLDMWTLFHLAKPKYFRSYWKFVNAFHYVLDNEFGRKEILGIRNEEQWYRTRDSLCSIATKDSVAAEVGQSHKPQRQLLHVMMDPIQARHYNEISKDMFTVIDGKPLLIPSSLTRILRLRQLLVCPKILSPNLPSYGAAIEDLIETLADTETDPHIVIFTPFTEAIPWFRERLLSANHAHIYHLQGGITPDEQVQQITSWRKTRGILICSTLYAESFSLEPAAECFHIGYDFNPEVNDQADHRLQRLLTPYPINAYYYAYEDTYDSRLAEIVCIKQNNANKTLAVQAINPFPLQT